MGPFKCYITFFLQEIGPPDPPPRNANNIEPYTFITDFPGKCDTQQPRLHYVTLEWPTDLVSTFIQIACICLYI